MTRLRFDDEEIQRRVRRFAVLRAALRALREVTPPEAFEAAEDEGRRLLERLRAVTGSDPSQAELLEPKQALDAIDGRLEALAADVRTRLQAVPVRTLCSTLDRMVGPESGALRALAATASAGDLDAPGQLARIELLVTLLCVEGPAGSRSVVRSPLDALPELARIDRAEIYESHPDIAEAEQILGRAVRRLDADDAGAARDRILRYKQRLGARLLHPTVLQASVAYNTEMSNRLTQLLDHEHALDAFADTLLGLQSDGSRASRPSAKALLPTSEDGTPRSRLLWHTLATASLAIGLLFIGAALLLLVTGARRSALCALGLGLVHAAPELALHLPRAGASRDDAEALRVVTLNLFERNEDVDAVRRLVDAERPDVLALQEVSAPWLSRLDEFAGSLPHRVVSREEGPRAASTFRLALLSRLPITDERRRRVEHPGGRFGREFLRVTLEHGSGDVPVVVAHPERPGRGDDVERRNRELALVAELAGGHPRAVVVGDLNTTSGSWAFARLLEDGGLRDSRRGFGRQPSWRTWKPIRGIGFAIDHVLVGPRWTVAERRLGAPAGSDHRPVVAVLLPELSR